MMKKFRVSLVECEWRAAAAGLKPLRLPRAQIISWNLATRKWTYIIDWVGRIYKYISAHYTTLCMYDMRCSESLTRGAPRIFLCCIVLCWYVLSCIVGALQILLFFLCRFLLWCFDTCCLVLFRVAQTRCSSYFCGQVSVSTLRKYILHTH